MSFAVKLISPRISGFFSTSAISSASPSPSAASKATVFFIFPFTCTITVVLVLRTTVGHRCCSNASCAPMQRAACSSRQHAALFCGAKGSQNSSTCFTWPT